MHGFSIADSTPRYCRDTFVETVTDKPFLMPFQRVVYAVLPAFWTLSHREVAVALELDFGEVYNERVFDAIL